MSRAQRPPSDIFDAGQALFEHTAKSIEILERAMQGAPQERRDPSPDSDADAAPAAPYNTFGPRTPCRICGDLSLYAIHWWCEQREIENATRPAPQSLLDRWDEQDRKIHDAEAGRDEGDADASQSLDETEP